MNDIRLKQLNLRVSEKIHMLFYQLCKKEGLSGPDLVTSMILSRSIDSGIVFDNPVTVEVDESLFNERTINILMEHFVPTTNVTMLRRLVGTEYVWDEVQERRLDELFASKNTDPLQGAVEIVRAVDDLLDRDALPRETHDGGPRSSILWCQQVMKEYRNKKINDNRSKIR